MSKEVDRLIIEALGWTEVDRIEKLFKLEPYVRYVWEKDGTCIVKFPTGRTAYNFSPSTFDSAAWDGIKALARMGWAYKILSDDSGVSLELTPPQQYVLKAGVGEGDSPLSAALEQVMKGGGGE